jgi:hypothetical protein
MIGDTRMLGALVGDERQHGHGRIPNCRTQMLSAKGSSAGAT